jgi:hypothetical protein
MPAEIADRWYYNSMAPMADAFASSLTFPQGEVRES